MKIFECTNCGHIEFGEAADVCLVCRCTTFEENAAAIKQPANPAELTEAEKKHIPQIIVVKDCGLISEGDCTDVHVRVGEILHVMEDEHYIRSLDYYLDHKFISRVWLSPNTCFPATALHMNATAGTVTAIENCNKHGNWMAEVAI